MNELIERKEKAKKEYPGTIQKCDKAFPAVVFICHESRLVCVDQEKPIIFSSRPISGIGSLLRSTESKDPFDGPSPKLDENRFCVRDFGSHCIGASLYMGKNNFVSKTAFKVSTLWTMHDDVFKSIWKSARWMVCNSCPREIVFSKFLLWLKKFKKLVNFWHACDRNVSTCFWNEQNSPHLVVFHSERRTKGLVRITSWYPNFNGSHFGLPPSEIHRMTGLPPKIVWTMTYSHRPHFVNPLCHSTQHPVCSSKMFSLFASKSKPSRTSSSDNERQSRVSSKEHTVLVLDLFDKFSGHSFQEFSKLLPTKKRLSVPK